MPSATSPSQSILKPSFRKVASIDNPTPPTLSKEERNRQLALHHAHLLQYRKDIEARNLTSTEKLLDLPSSPCAVPSAPLDTDSKAVKDALKTFQPSDFDALVEERNIDNKCGYALCPRKNRRQTWCGNYRIVTGSRKTDFNVVKASELERWCSDECGQMALNLRVQLSEEPAWTREWQAAEPLQLFNEDVAKKIRNGDDISRGNGISGKTEVSSDKHDVVDRLRDLAIERGDKGNIDGLSAKVAINVKDNIFGEQMRPVPPFVEGSSGDCIEGYVPTGKHLTKQISNQGDDEEDMMPTI